MARLWFVLGLVVVILTIYTLVECAMFDRGRIRGLPRWVWLFVIVLVPVIGPLLWLVVGRGRRETPGLRASRSFAPDDDPDFLKQLDREKNQAERIRQMERELADLDSDSPLGGTPPGSSGGKTAGTPGGKASGTAGGGAAGAAGIPPQKNDPGEGDLPGRRDA
ncbi:PLD nuclease N-terminal domain-containing protein [Glaciibacter sp. 2TAF33]|uniref:PLD nuclease N-terminal domain-containing protein n=1 Tax=Glaciibacter sp. 2TAF33 TaxID=3233015 RepID=UPI003F8F0DA0